MKVVPTKFADKYINKYNIELIFYLFVSNVPVMSDTLENRTRTFGNATNDVIEILKPTNNTTGTT